MGLLNLLQLPVFSSISAAEQADRRSPFPLGAMAYIDSGTDTEVVLIKMRKGMQKLYVDNMN